MAKSNLYNERFAAYSSSGGYRESVMAEEAWQQVASEDAERDINLKQREKTEGHNLTKQTPGMYFLQQGRLHPLRFHYLPEQHHPLGVKEVTKYNQEATERRKKP